MNGSWLIVLSGLLVMLIALRRVLCIVRVEGPSMMPTLSSGDRLLVLRLWPARWLRKRQIIVTGFPPFDAYHNRHAKSARGALFIKRIVGLPGDALITSLADLPDPLRPGAQVAHDERGQRTWHVPPNHYFVRGDSLGYDSAIAGPVPFSFLRGIVLLKLPGRVALDPNSTSAPNSLLQ